MQSPQSQPDWKGKGPAGPARGRADSGLQEGADDDNSESEPGEDEDEGELKHSGELSELVLAVDYCRKIENGSKVYGFQVAVAEVKEVGMKVQSEGCLCSCEVVDCQHLLWLKSKIGCTDTTSCYQRIEEQGFDDLCRKKRWDKADFAVQSPAWELRKTRRGHRSEEMIFERLLVVREILATFSAESFTKDFRTDLFAVQDQSLLSVVEKNLLVHRDLEAT